MGRDSAASPVRLAVIGSGIMGANHARVAAGLPDLALVAVLDPCRERSAKLAAAFGARAVVDLRELPGLVDAAVVATPTDLHVAVALELIDAGIDVLVEKPIACDVESAQRLVDAADAAGRVLMIGHVERYNPAVLELDTVLDDVVHIEARRISAYSPRIRDDVVRDLMIHDLDLVSMVAGGAPVEVMSVLRAPRSESPDIAAALLAFDSGVTASVMASRVGQNKIRQMDITQADSYVTIDLLRQDLSVQHVDQSEYLSDHGRRYRQVGVVELPFLQHRGEPLALELAHFAECVRTRARPRTTGPDAIRALDLALRVAAAPVR
jgi:predicted dehydrogenase